ncbi:MAG: NADH-quinone oxidoreductase subunit L [Phycisphaerae bacterium]|nr:NADH-quinone oxidoreductase subunit L [Phycisphaerae bacterium]
MLASVPPIQLDAHTLNSVYATLPLWPLFGTVAIGLMLAFNRAKEMAHYAVIAGVGAAAVLAGGVFYSMLNDGAAAAHGPGHADAARLMLVSDPPAQHAPADAHAPAAAHAPASASSAAAGHGAHGDHGPHILRYHQYTAFHWFSLGLIGGQTRWVDVNFFVDSLTGVMLIVVTFVALMVVIYSVGYMRDHHGHQEEGYERFFAWLGLFVFSMLMLVLAGNFVLLYLGWEAVGLCSYLLIGFYYQKPAAAAAAKKAFLVNRIGDFGFALGIFAIYHFLSPIVQPGENPLDYATLFKYVDKLETMSLWGVSAPTLIGLLLLCGALGKSAQFPIYVWLPDAMEGPSPVSALIHAATMVTAGVYMVARLGPIYARSPEAMDVVMWVGIIGAVLAATMAMAQHDMKRILAYSTMSQLAFMFVALGVGAPQAAIFHLYTHAFFKALLFLCAGGVMHSMGNIIDVRYFSGLKSVLPSTYRLMFIGCLALAGFPLLSGFWSKDEIVHAALDNRPWVGYVLLFTAAMTAYYTFRMFFLCFNGPTRTPPEAGDHPHDSPPVMTWPLYPLALGAIAAGFVGYGGHDGFFHKYVADSSMVATAAHTSAAWPIMLISGAIAIGAIFVAFARYGDAPRNEPDQQLLGPLWNLWNAKYLVDEIYDAIFVRPLRAFGKLLFDADRHGVDGVVNAVGATPGRLSSIAAWTQRGALQGYAVAMVLGLGLVFIVWRWLTPATGL